MLTITIETEGAAFVEDAASEVERILRRAAEKVRDGDVVEGERVPLLDVNGNTCGHVNWED